MQTCPASLVTMWGSGPLGHPDSISAAGEKKNQTWRRAVPSPSISSPLPDQLCLLEPKCHEPKAEESKEPKENVLGGSQTITNKVSSAPVHLRKEQRHHMQWSSSSAQHKARTLPGNFVSNLSRASFTLTKVSGHKRRQANTSQEPK